MRAGPNELLNVVKLLDNKGELGLWMRWLGHCVWNC